MQAGNGSTGGGTIDIAAGSDSNGNGGDVNIASSSNDASVSDDATAPKNVSRPKRSKILVLILGFAVLLLVVLPWSWKKQIKLRVENTSALIASWIEEDTSSSD